jgi:large subunit ribosomal protein L33
MSQDRLIKIINKATGTTIYTTKNKKKVTRKIELKKYDPVLRKRVTFKEAKK